MLEKLRIHLDSGRPPHAIVIDGGNEASRLSEALEFSAGLLCTSDGHKPCGTCSQCKKVLAKAHPDVQFIVRESDKKNISVKILRDMRDDAFIIPNDSDRKIYIIPHAEEIEAKNQNALLKILEEPPTYVTFILLCPSHSVLIDTIISRVSLFSLEEENEMKKADYERSCELASLIAEGLAMHNEGGVILTAAAFEKNSDLMSSTLEELKLIVRDALVVNYGEQCISPYKDVAQKLAVAYSSESLLKLQGAIKDLDKAISVHSNKNLMQARLSSHLFAAVL